MSDWWYIIAVVAVVALGVQYLRHRRTGKGRIGADPQTGASVPRAYKQEREDVRHAHMTAEDRAWEAASLQRNRETQEGADTRAEQRA